jgi:hypothetical protein
MMHTATTIDLAQLGFTPEQIKRLEALREAGPLLEFITTRAEWQRLVFLKWCYEHGQQPSEMAV